MDELANTHDVDDVGTPEAMEQNITTEEPEVQDPATEDVQEPVATEPEPEPQKPDFTGRELEWLRTTVQRQNSLIEQLRQERDEYELAGMDPDEAAQKRIERLQAELDQQRQAEQARQARQEWQQYYTQFGVPEEALVGDDPIQWQHATLTHLQEKAAKALEQVAALKKVQESPRAPKVSSKPGSQPNKKTVWDYSFDEINQMADEIRFGQRDPGDIPPME